MEEKNQGSDLVRKYLIGALVGLSLSFAFSAHAAVENLIGRVVEGVFPVKVNGIKIDKQAIVIDGTSYLPVRAIGDALNIDIDFNADLGIELTQKAGAKMSAQIPQDTVKLTPKRVQKVKNNLDNSGLKENGEYGLIEMDGNQYVSISTLGGSIYTIYWTNPNLIFHQKDKPDITVNVSDSYQPNVDGFNFEGSAYVKLSLLGLKATVQGDTLIIQ